MMSVRGLQSPGGVRGGGGGGGAGDGGMGVVRITAKEVQVGEGLFNSGMEWDQLTDSERNPFALAFRDGELESSFQSHFFLKFLVPNRKGLLSFLVSLLLLGIYETLLHLPETAHESKIMAVTWLLRLFALLVGAGLYIFTYTHKAIYERMQQPLLTCGWALMGFVLITNLAAFDTYEEVYGVTCVLLLLTMTSTFVGLQFRWVMLVSICFLLWYLSAALIVNNTFPLLVLFLLASNVLAITASRSSEYYLRWDFIRHLKLQQEERRTRHFLNNMLPLSVIQEIKQDRRFIAHEFPRASVMFSDVVSFTALASRIRPEDVVAILNVMFSTADALSTKHGIYKVETIGDAYLACSGVVSRNATQTEDLVKFALDLQTSTRFMHTPEGLPLVIRIGIHTGSVVAGVVGRKMPRYHLFGETVTIAEEMEQNGIAGHVCISAATWAECEGLFEVEKLEPIVLHAKPAKNILPGEAAAAAASKDKAAVSTSTPASDPHLHLDESRMIHRYKVLAPLGDMSGHHHRAATTGATTMMTKAAALLSVADADEAAQRSSSAKRRLRSVESSPASRPTSASAAGPAGSPNGADDFDRAPPPFVSQILARINALNFANAQGRAQRNDAKIQAALTAAKAKAESNPARTYHPSQFAAATAGAAAGNGGPSSPRSPPVIIHSPPNGVH